MVLPSSWVATHPLHQSAGGRAIHCTLKLIPTPSQPGQKQNKCNDNQPTHRDRSKTKTARPKLFFITKMGPNAGGDALAIVNRTRGNALQACLN